MHQIFLYRAFIMPVLKHITDIQYFAAWNILFSSPGTEAKLIPRSSIILSFKCFLHPSSPHPWSTTVADSTVSSTFILNSWHYSQWSYVNLQQLKIWPNSAVLLHIVSSPNKTKHFNAQRIHLSYVQHYLITHWHWIELYLECCDECL